ncbi:hypothetical protein SAV31267_059230 [Streptomyces avermitilis]|uniref:Uncharacterized protein n=1 Tax=Streptomyces avermitilis TaxID=33903 RepID=A0A4D4MW70_STRAX|nr:hypothetical protein SAV31267_059230 [Streptomyces avermitilis]
MRGPVEQRPEEAVDVHRKARGEHGVAAVDQLVRDPPAAHRDVLHTERGQRRPADPQPDAYGAGAAARLRDDRAGVVTGCRARGTLTVNGTSARVRAGTVTDTADAARLCPPVARAKPIHAPVPTGPLRTPSGPSAPRSRTVSGVPPGLSTDTASSRTVPLSPSA